MKTEAQKRAQINYRARHYEQIAVQIRKDGGFTREDVKAWAEACGLSVNEYILQAIQEKHEKE